MEASHVASAVSEGLGTLSDTSFQEYKKLQKKIQSLIQDNPSKSCIEAFDKIISLIEHYVSKGNDDYINRSYACGYLCMTDSIATNINQLKKLIGRQKTTIDNGLKKIGCNVVRGAKEQANELINSFPSMKGNYELAKQWTIRKKDNTSSNAAPLNIPFFNIDTEMNQSDCIYDYSFDFNDP